MYVVQRKPYARYEYAIMKWQKKWQTFYTAWASKIAQTHNNNENWNFRQESHPNMAVTGFWCLFYAFLLLLLLLLGLLFFPNYLGILSKSKACVSYISGAKMSNILKTVLGKRINATIVILWYMTIEWNLSRYFLSERKIRGWDTSWFAHCSKYVLFALLKMPEHWKRNIKNCRGFHLIPMFIIFTSAFLQNGRPLTQRKKQWMNSKWAVI